jgi:hypothetical protein
MMGRTMTPNQALTGLVRLTKQNKTVDFQLASCNFVDQNFFVFVNYLENGTFKCLKAVFDVQEDGMVTINRYEEQKSVFQVCK